MLRVQFTNNVKVNYGVPVMSVFIDDVETSIFFRSQSFLNRILAQVDHFYAISMAEDVWALYIDDNDRLLDGRAPLTMKKFLDTYTIASNETMTIPLTGNIFKTNGVVWKLITIGGKKYHMTFEDKLLLDAFTEITSNHVIGRYSSHKNLIYLCDGTNQLLRENAKTIMVICLISDTCALRRFLL